MNVAHYGYHKKHRSAAARRASFIIDHSDAGSRFLDVGCNAGHISRSLLQIGKAAHVHGMDLSRAVVDPGLMSHERFSFREGDIAHADYLPASDYSIYSAVHHHVMYNHGLTAATRCIRLIARSTERAIFFESGRIAESSYWPWQQAIRQYFRTDEEHYAYLLSSLEGAIEHVELVGKVRIHGIKRWFLKVSLMAPADRPQELEADAPPRTAKKNLVRIRRFGSRHAGLFPLPEHGNSDSPCEFVCDETAGKSFFIKRHVHRPFYSRLEYEVGLQIERPWAVRPIELASETAEITFPLVQYDTINGPESLLDADRARLVQDLIHIFREARAVQIQFGPESWRFRNTQGSLLDFCDLNFNNVLLVRVNGKTEVRIVDFEPQGTRIGFRNRLNQAAVLRALGRKRLRVALFASAGYLTFFFSAACAHFRSIPARLGNGIPTLGSLILAEISTFFGWRARKLADFFRD